MSQVAWPLAEHICTTHHTEVILPAKSVIKNPIARLHTGDFGRVRESKNFILSKRAGKTRYLYSETIAYIVRQ